MASSILAAPEGPAGETFFTPAATCGWIKTRNARNSQGNKAGQPAEGWPNSRLSASDQASDRPSNLLKPAQHPGEWAHPDRCSRSSLARRAEKRRPPHENNASNSPSASQTFLSLTTVNVQPILILSDVSATVAIVTDRGPTCFDRRGQRTLDGCYDPRPTFSSDPARCTPWVHLRVVECLARVDVSYPNDELRIHEKVLHGPAHAARLLKTRATSNPLESGSTPSRASRRSVAISASRSASTNPNRRGSR